MLRRNMRKGGDVRVSVLSFDIIVARTFSDCERRGYAGRHYHNAGLRHSYQVLWVSSFRVWLEGSKKGYSPFQCVSQG